MLGWERCPAETPQLPVLVWELRICCRLCLLEYPRGGIIHGEECPLRGLAWFLGLCFACWWAAPELGVSRRFPVHARPPALRGAAPHRCHRQMELPEHSLELSSGPWTLLFLLGQHRRWVCRDTWKSARSSVRSSRNRPRRAFPLQHLYCYRSFFCHET